MNILVTSDPHELRKLADVREVRSSCYRMLFIGLDALGWQTGNRTLMDTTATRDDVVAAHWHLQPDVLFRIAGAPVRGLPAWMHHRNRRVLLWRVRLQHWIRRYLDINEFDVVHVSPHLVGWGVLPFLKQRRSTLSVWLDATVRQARGELRNVSPEEVEENFPTLIAAEKATLRRADLVACMSAWALKGVRSASSCQPPAMVLPPTVSVDEMSRVRWLDEDVTFGPLRISFVGNNWVRKGGPQLLDWHQSAWADRAELHICSADAPTGLRLPNVIVYGRMPREFVLNELLPATHVLVLPSIRDMSPWALVEAAGVGVPIVAFEVGGIADIVRDGETGFLVPPGDAGAFQNAVATLLRNGTLRRRMAVAARSHAEVTLNRKPLMNAFLDRLLAEVTGRWTRCD